MLITDPPNLRATHQWVNVRKSWNKFRSKIKIFLNQKWPSSDKSPLMLNCHLFCHKDAGDKQAIDYILIIKKPAENIGWSIHNWVLLLLPVDNKKFNSPKKPPLKSQMVLIEPQHPFQPLHGKWLLPGSHWRPVQRPGAGLMLFGDLPQWFNAPFHTSCFRTCERVNCQIISPNPFLQQCTVLDLKRGHEKDHIAFWYLFVIRKIL